MDIVIAGAGDVGFHLAKLLATEDHNITIIDINDLLLEQASSKLDVSTIKGDASSLQVLDKAEIWDADIFISVTTFESTNLLACILAKKKGAKQTIARVSNPEYLQKDQKHRFAEVGVDNLLSPSMLAVNEIKRLIQRISATDIFDFEGGKISIIGFTADSSSKLLNKSLKQLGEEASNYHTRVILVLRDNVPLMPKDDLIIKDGDHIYFSTDVDDFIRVNSFYGKELRKVKRIMIIGDTPLAMRTAQSLEKDYKVSLIINKEHVCSEFAEVLSDTLIINGDYDNIDLLREEGLERMDVFIALTPSAESNIITSLMADKAGVRKTIALVDNSAFTHISQSIGIDTLINKQILAANNIFRYVRKGKVEAIASFHGVDAEVIEFIIHPNNRLIKKSIQEIGLPAGAIVAGVVRNNEGIIPTNDFIISQEDKVIVFVLPTVIKQVEALFV